MLCLPSPPGLTFLENPIITAQDCNYSDVTPKYACSTIDLPNIIGKNFRFTAFKFCNFLCSEIAQDIINAMNARNALFFLPPISEVNATAICNAVSALVACGVWDKIDALCLINDQEPSSLVDWKLGNENMSANWSYAFSVNLTPIYTANFGWQFLKTLFNDNPSLAITDNLNTRINRSWGFFVNNNTAPIFDIFGLNNAGSQFASNRYISVNTTVFGGTTVYGKGWNQCPTGNVQPAWLNDYGMYAARLHNQIFGNVVPCVTPNAQLDTFHNGVIQVANLAHVDDYAYNQTIWAVNALAFNNATTWDKLVSGCFIGEDLTVADHCCISNVFYNYMQEISGLAIPYTQC
jgi:hypothetical protein